MGRYTEDLVNIVCLKRNFAHFMLNLLYHLQQFENLFHKFHTFLKTLNDHLHTQHEVNKLLSTNNFCQCLCHVTCNVHLDVSLLASLKKKSNVRRGVDDDGVKVNVPL